MKGWKILGSLGKWTVRVLAALLFLVMLGGALLQTPWAKTRLASALARAFSAEGRRVSIGPVHGLIPFDVRVAEIRLADSAGEWLCASGVQVRISAPDLWARRLVVRELSAAGLHLSRRPAVSGPSATAGPAVPPWAHLPAIEVDRFRVDEWVLDEPVAGERMTWRVQGRAHLDPDTGARWTIQAQRLDDIPGFARMTAWLSGQPAVLRLDAELLDDPRGPLARRLPTPAAGPVRARVGGAGPLQAFQGTALAEADGLGRLTASFTADARPPLAVDFQLSFHNDGALPASFQQAELSGSLHHLLEQPGGEITGTLMRGDEVFTARAAVVYRDRQVEVSNLDFRAGTLSVKGDLDFDPATRLAEGRLTAEMPYLSDLSDRFGWRVGGEARLDIDLDPAGTGQKATIHGEGRNLTAPFAGASEFRVDACLYQLGHDPTGSVEVVLKDISMNRVTFSNLAFRAEGDQKRWAWSMKSAGRLTQSFDLVMAGRFDGLGTGAVWVISEMSGRFGIREYRMEDPARIELGGNRCVWGPMAWRVGSGRLTTSGALTEEEVEATVQLDGLPLDVLSKLGWPDLKGHASGRLEVRGRVDQPAADLELKFTGVTPRQPLVIPLAPAEADVRVHAGDGRLYAEWTLSGPARISGELGLPLQWSLRPLRWRFPSPAPLTGRLEASADLAGLIPASVLEDRVIRGELHAELELGGSLDAPDIDGVMALQDGYYENLTLGTVLQDVMLQARSDLTSLVITNASATDGRGGKVDLTGRLDYSPARQFPFELNVRFKDAALVRQDHLSLDADGEVTLSGSFARSLLAGRLHVRQLDYESVERPSAAIPQLGVVEINRPGRKEAAPGSTNGSVRPLELDLDVSAPARIYIGGRGLNSEWRGRLHIGGSLDQPSYSGSLDVLRGRFLFLGRRFTLEQAVVSLDGRVPADPQLDVSATADAAGMAARLSLSGPWSSPTWALSSEPTLPADEIMAQLLFGRSVDRISALQAIRLAYGLNMLRGGGSTFDVLGRGQNLLRVDQFDIKQDADDPTLSSIAVGKYVGDRVYIEGEKSLAGQGDVIMLEFELSRSLRLQTETSPQIREGIRLNWSRDY